MIGVDIKSMLDVLFGFDFGFEDGSKANENWDIGHCRY